ncbi:MAG: T9SS type A sorting domain-containing protein [Bacteroidota bacterium]|nr:T9SS type A sorting domain-containing protein [Bacteroidota bacterium]
MHLSQTTRVQIDCGTELEYEVRAVLFDTSAEIIIRPLTAVVVDENGEVDLGYDTELASEFDIMQNGLPYTSGCQPYHRIIWFVIDSCGNESRLEKQINLYDCSKPTFVLSDDLLIIVAGGGGNFRIKIDTLIQSWLDDCSTSSELMVSLLPDRVLTDTSYYICVEPNWGVPVNKFFWIADKGKDTDCNGIIEWSERSIYQDSFIVVFTDNGMFDCGDPNDPMISGEIHTKYLHPVEKVEVTLTSPGILFPTYITAGDGKYHFSNLVLGEDYEISCERNDNHKNGVSTLDLVRIQKHLLGIEDISSPYDLIAADANNSQNISAIDLIELRKLILGIYQEFPANKSWRFIPADFEFNNPDDPNPYSETILIHDLGSSIAGLDFVAIKIGDVNGTVQPNATSILTRSNNSPVGWQTHQQTFKANDLISIPIYSTSEFSMEGFQFTMSEPDLEFLGVVPGQISMTDDTYALLDDHMTCSWFDLDAKEVNQSDPLFTVMARAKRKGSLAGRFSINSEMTDAEVHDAEQNIYEPHLVIKSAGIEEYVTVFPNPWKENVSFSFNTKEKGIAELNLYDAVGKKVFSIAKEVFAGDNMITVDKQPGIGSGLFLYELITNNFRRSGMVLKF